MAGIVFQPSATITVSVTSTSGNAALPTGSGGVLELVNAGTKVCFVSLSELSGSTAAITDYPVLGGETKYILRGAATRIAAICGGSDTTTLYVTQGVVQS